MKTLWDSQLVLAHASLACAPHRLCFSTWPGQLLHLCIDPWLTEGLAAHLALAPQGLCLGFDQVSSCTGCLDLVLPGADLPLPLRQVLLPLSETASRPLGSLQLGFALRELCGMLAHLQMTQGMASQLLEHEPGHHAGPLGSLQLCFALCEARGMLPYLHVRRRLARHLLTWVSGQLCAVVARWHTCRSGQEQPVTC